MNPVIRRRKVEAHRNGNYYGHVNGKRINLGRNRKAAERKLAKIDREIAIGRYNPNGEPARKGTPVNGVDPLVMKVAEDHLIWVKDNRKNGTYAPRKIYVNRFIRFIGKRKLVSEVTQEDIENFINHEKKHYGYRGINAGIHARRNIKTMFLWGQERELFTVPVPRFPKMTEVTPETELFSPEELSAVYNVASNNLRDIIVFGLATGLRPQEIVTLQKRHIITIKDEMIAHIEISKTSRMAKTSKPRSVPLHDSAMKIVRKQLEQHPESEYVFLNSFGKPYTASALRNHFRKTCIKANVKPRKTYTLRHVFATTLDARGIPTGLCSNS